MSGCEHLVGIFRAAAEAGKSITLEGQEMDVTTAGLARMNMILHDFPTASILSGNTLAAPKFKDGENLRTYDYVVANPPFSNKTWSVGLTPENDPFQRFTWGVPPTKRRLRFSAAHRPFEEGDRQSRLHLPTVAIPRNAERDPPQLVSSGSQGIIGLQANLFYGHRNSRLHPGF